VTKWAFVGTRGVIGLVLVPFLAAKVGRAGYGLIALASVIVSFAALADLGLRTGLGRHLAAQVARRDTAQFNELASTGMAAYMIIGTLCTGVVIAFAPLLVQLFNVSQEMVPQAVFIVRWYGSVAVLMSFLMPVFGATLTSNNRYDIVSYIGTGWAILQGAGIFLVLGLTQVGLYGWAVVAIAAETLRFLAIRYAAYRIHPGLKLRLRHVRKHASRSLFSLGGKAFVLRATDLVSVRADPIIITRFFGPAGVALYYPGLQLTTFAREIINALNAQLHPVATACHVTGKTEQLRSVLFRGTRYTLLMGIAPCIALVLFAHPIMKVWIGGTPIGEGYRTAAWILLGWAMVDLLNYASGTQGPVLLGMNRLKFLVWVQAVGGVINVLASIWLVGYTSLGVVGVIVPTIVITAIRRPLIATYTAWACGTSAHRYFSESYARPMVVIGLLGVAATAIRILIDPQSMLSVIACVAGVGILWVPLCWWIGFNAADRASFLGLFRRVLAKVRAALGGGSGRDAQGPAGPTDPEAARAWDDQAPGTQLTDNETGDDPLRT
jgi:O-antigen/teichoic acid export membrane protein